MKIGVFSQYSFPYGGAATNRILAYCKALLLNGAEVKVYIPLQTDYKINNDDEVLLPDQGQYLDVNYQYTYNRYRSRFKFIRGCMRFFYVKQMLAFVTFINAFNTDSRKCKFDSIIFSTDTLFYLLIGKFISRVYKTKVIFIFDEYPIPIRHKLKDTIPKWKERFYAFILKSYAGYISISTTLKGYFQELSCKPCFVMPVIVDTTKFESAKHKKFNSSEYICYMGNFELAKDNVDLIIKAFSLVHKEYPALKLFLYGNPKPLDKNKVIKLIDDLKLEDVVKLKGFVKNTEVPNILHNAKVLVSSQPDTKRAKGGFPTKLAEYITTGKPTLLTEVGENGAYVINNVHCFMVPAHDHVIYANKLVWILDNYEDALIVADNGKKFIKEKYSLKNIGNELISFIDGL